VLALRAAREKTAANKDPDGAERDSVSGLSEPSELGDYKKPESRARTSNMSALIRKSTVPKTPAVPPQLIPSGGHFTPMGAECELEENFNG